MPSIKDMAVNKVSVPMKRHGKINLYQNVIKGAMKKNNFALLMQAEMPMDVHRMVRKG